MNLFDMVHRKDPNLVVDGATPDMRETAGATWRGLALLPQDRPQLRLRTAPRWYPFAERPAWVGWYVCTVGKASGLTLEAWFEDGGRRIGAGTTVAVGEVPQPVRIPWPEAEALPPTADLVLHLRGRSGRALLAVHRALDRARFVEGIRGVGVEIGPGHQPQVLPRPGVEVTYVEQMPAESWKELYASKRIRPELELWKNYRIGEARKLPAEDGSLDFVFSSHVFEHLPDPLGHLEHWRDKLRPGGRVFGVVPDTAGCKDYPFRPTSLEELLDEHVLRLAEPTEFHYRRYLGTRNPNADVPELMRKRSSIHVHFFTHRNMAETLQHAVDRLGFAWFSLMHEPNHKDFHFVLAKGGAAPPAPETPDEARLARARARFGLAPTA